MLGPIGSRAGGRPLGGSRALGRRDGGAQHGGGGRQKRLLGGCVLDDGRRRGVGRKQSDLVFLVIWTLSGRHNVDAARATV